MRLNHQFPADLTTFTVEILNGKLHFCVVVYALPDTFLFYFCAPFLFEVTFSLFLCLSFSFFFFFLELFS